MYVVGGIVSPRLPLIAVQDGFAVGAGARASAPLGLLQGWTRRTATPRFYRDLPRPLRLTYPAATTARAPRAPPCNPSADLQQRYPRFFAFLIQTFIHLA